jgi:PAS domain S-box-containing protein
MSGKSERLRARANQPVNAAQTLSSARFTADFAKLNSVDYLHYDQRPTFVLDLEAYRIKNDPLSPLAFCNSALLNSFGLYGVVNRTFSLKATEKQHEDERAFAAWVIHQSASKRLGKSKAFFHTLWTVASTSDDWAIISGVELSQSDFGSFNASQDSEENSVQTVEMPNVSPRNSLSSIEADIRSDNATQRPRASLGAVWPPAGLCSSTHISLIRDFDWASTSVGPLETWPSQLKQACEMMLVSPEPVAIFWGPDLIMLYNEAYVAIAANKHPEMMGGSARVHWKEIWDVYDPLFDQIRVDGKALKQANAQVFLQRVGYLEEGFFNLIVLPLLGDDGSVVGFYEPVSEVTKQTLSERRMHTLLKVSEFTSSATSLKDLWRLLLKPLAGKLDCLHFAMLYSLRQNSSPTLSPQYSLEGSVGFTGETSSFRSVIDIEDPAQDGILPALREAHESRTLVLLKSSDGSLSPSILQRLDSAGLKEPPRECIVCPLSSSVDDSIDAFLIIGINPHRCYDQDYQLFVDLLGRQVESTVTLVKLFEKERERVKQQALYESELKFKRFAENAQVGIFSGDPAGNITFCNESWLEISGHDRNDMSAMSWANDVHPDSAPVLAGCWDKLINLRETQTFEVAYKKPWKLKGRVDDSISLDRTWAVASAYAEVSNDGKLTGILGCVTDISSWKWADLVHSRRLSEALELKRQQENFLDITSHE